MNNRELKIKTISNEFVRWQIQIENLSFLNLYDLNIFSEYSICEILNVIFDYELQNINLYEKNYPAIDLVDNNNRIAFQVTSTNQKSKIQGTLNKFFANNLNERYDILYVVVLGNKQKKYSNLKLPIGYIFNETEHILDFKDILKRIISLPLSRIERIANILEHEHCSNSIKKPNNNITTIKKKLSLKKRLKNDLQIELNPEFWKRARYEPWIKFKYHNVIIRSIDDKSWPNIDNNKNKISSWFKGEIWNFYENGLELISDGGSAIFNENGFWDIIDFVQDEMKLNPKYSIVDYWLFLRIPYEFIVDYDMEPDKYYSLPTIYVEYAKDNMPYEEVLYGLCGYYDKENPAKSEYACYFDNEKRKKLV